MPQNSLWSQAERLKSQDTHLQALFHLIQIQAGSTLALSQPVWKLRSIGPPSSPLRDALYGDAGRN